MLSLNTELKVFNMKRSVSNNGFQTSMYDQVGLVKQNVAGILVLSQN